MTTEALGRSAVDGLLLDHLAHDPADPAVVRAGARRLLRSWAPGSAPGRAVG